MKKPKAAFLVFCITAHLVVEVYAASDSFKRITAEARSKVVATETYKLDTAITFTLDRGSAIQLNCADNTQGVEKYVIYYYTYADSYDVVRVDGYLDDGTVGGGGTRVKPDGSCNSQAGVRGSGCRAFTEWQIKGDKAFISFRVSTEARKPQELPEVDRIAGFARLWSEVKYNFAFFDQVPEIDWDEILVDYLPHVQAAKTDVAYYEVLRECIALLRDGHTSVTGPADSPSGFLPFRLQRVEGLATITSLPLAHETKKVAWKEALEQASLQLGEAIIDINGVPVGEILAKDICPYISASTSQALHRKAYSLLVNGPAGGSVVCRVRGLDGKERRANLYYGRYPFPDDPEKTVADPFVYINITGFSSDRAAREFDAKLNEIKQSQGLILDVRQNGGGSTRHGYAIVSRLIKETIPGSHWRSPKHIAAYKAWGRDVQWQEGDHGRIEPHKSIHYGGPVVVLTGPGTVSAAEDFVVAFQTSGRGKVIGQKTNGSTGQPLRVQLPGGGSARICTKRDTYPDGRDFVGIGCIPDIEIEPARRDVAAGRDPVLEEAVEVLGRSS